LLPFSAADGPYQCIRDPRVIADITNFVGYANANSAATPLIDASILSDTVVYPPRDQQERLFVQMQDPPEQARAITRLLQRFKTGQ
jgi:putrescine transport system substrate-binding protein